MTSKQFEFDGVPTPPRLPRNGRGIREGSFRWNTEFLPEMAAFEEWMQAVKWQQLGGVAPVTRSWCYIFAEMGWISKGNLNAGKQWLSEMRKKCLIDLKLVGLDVSRPVISNDFTDKEDTAMESFRKSMRIALDYKTYSPHSYWEFQKYFPIVWSEKLDIIKMLNGVIPSAVVKLAGKGWSDINSRVQVMAHCEQAVENGLIPVILYLGDLDPVGVQIADNLRSNLKDLEDACEWWGVDNIIIKRVALTKDFIEENHLPWIDGLETSSGQDLANPKHKHHHMKHVQDFLQEYGPRKCEQNAMVLCVEAAKVMLRKELYTYLSEEGEAMRDEANAVADAEMRAICELAAKGLTFLEAQMDLFNPKRIAQAQEMKQLPGYS